LLARFRPSSTGGPRRPLFQTLRVFAVKKRSQSFAGSVAALSGGEEVISAGKGHSRDKQGGTSRLRWRAWRQFAGTMDFANVTQVCPQWCKFVESPWVISPIPRSQARRPTRIVAGILDLIVEPIIEVTSKAGWPHSRSGQRGWPCPWVSANVSPVGRTGVRSGAACRKLQWGVSPSLRAVAKDSRVQPCNQSRLQRWWRHEWRGLPRQRGAKPCDRGGERGLRQGDRPWAKNLFAHSAAPAMMRPRRIAAYR